jgi:CheY-like chemotaxis protein
MAPVRILVIEDNAANSQLLDFLLRAHGHTPQLAFNGEDGLRLALSQPPDLVLLDLRMPGMDGYEVAAEIGKHPELRDTRVVAVTASAMAGERERIVESGFHGYIQKPIDPETFMAQIAPFLPDNLVEHDAKAGAQ